MALPYPLPFWTIALYVVDKVATHINHILAVNFLVELFMAYYLAFTFHYYLPAAFAVNPSIGLSRALIEIRQRCCYHVTSNIFSSLRLDECRLALR